jgi:hypothetical protein
VRWDELFADLAAQLEDAAAADLAGEVADRTRREIATLTLVDRARAAVGHPVRVQLLGPEVVSGLLLEVGAQWVCCATRLDAMSWRRGAPSFPSSVSGSGRSRRPTAVRCSAG